MAWTLYQQAKTWNTRPSELLGVPNNWDAYCLDNAIWLLGSAIEGDLNTVEAKSKKEAATKRSQILRRWIPESAKARKFKDPFNRS